MSREKQIEEMAKALTKYEKGLCERLPKDKCLLTSAIHAQVSCDYCKIAEFLYNAGYRKQEWISVEDRLPQKHDEVLVFCDGARQLDFICSSGRWYDHDHKKVTHWMPLPEAPKGGVE